MNEAIATRELVKTYRGDVRALDGLGFSVEEGTVFGLLGRNGAGKSTTVKILPRSRGPTRARRGWRASTCSASRVACAA